MPLWLKWVLTVLSFAAVGATAVILLNRAGATNPSEAEQPAAVAQADREGQIVTRQDQAVHRIRLSRSLHPRAGLERAILLDMRTLVARHDLAGPAKRVGCRALARWRPDRRRFRCHALAGGFSYPFAGVADLSTRQLSWCKDDSTSVDPSLQVPLSPACTS